MPIGVYPRPAHKCPKCGGVPHNSPSMIKRRDYRCLNCSRMKHRERLRKKRVEKDPTLLARDRRNAEVQRQRFPEKIRARYLLAKAIQLGTSVRPDYCAKCGSQGRIEGHHGQGYDKPLIVDWLCVACHHAVHSERAKEIK